MCKVENIILRNEIKTLESSQNKDISNPMAQEVVLVLPEKVNILLVYPQRAQFWALYDFLGSAKFNLTYWNELEGYGEKVKSFNKFSTFYYSVETETWI